MARAKNFGSGWHGDTPRHKKAALTGHAGGTYARDNIIPRGSYRLQYTEFLKGGRADGLKDTAFNYEQLKKGEKEELEHTNNHKIAREIAKDHLVTDPLYYEKLGKIEKKEEYEVRPATDFDNTNMKGYAVFHKSGHRPEIGMGEPNWFDKKKDALKYKKDCIRESKQTDKILREIEKEKRG